MPTISEPRNGFSSGHSTVSQNKEPRLARVLGLRDLTLLVVSTVIGSGIFVVPGSVLSSVHNSQKAALTVWLAGGILSLLGALTYGELTAMKPDTGGIYIYIRDCFGPFPAFLFGWTLFFVISNGSIAALSVAFSQYLGEFASMSPVLQKCVSIAMIAAIGLVNVWGTRRSVSLQNVTTLLKVTAIIFMAGILVVFGAYHGRIFHEPDVVAKGSLLSEFMVAMVSVLWAYEGWQWATFNAGETIDPQRNYPRAFFLGSAILIGVYLIANVGYLSALGPNGVAHSHRVAVQAVLTAVGTIPAKAVAVAILISILSAANSVLLTASRVYFAMARDGLFFKRLGTVHPFFGTPVFSILAGTVWESLLAGIGAFDQLLTYVVFVGWIFYALAAASIFVYRTKEPGAPRPYKVPGYPYTPAIFIIAAAMLVVNTIVMYPIRGVIGLAIACLGAPAYLLWTGGRKNTLCSLTLSGGRVDESDNRESSKDRGSK